MNRNYTMLGQGRIAEDEQGFTLIELIIVIVILGILAVTAAPRFIDISTDARISALQGAGASVLSGASLVYAKSIIQGNEKIYVGNVDIDNDGVNDIQTIYGYPDSASIPDLQKFVELGDFTFYRSGFGTPTPAINITMTAVTASSLQVLNSNCYLSYNRSTAVGIKPTVTYVTTGC